jgi:hypothetical protein
MKELMITCASCRQSWKLEVEESVYLELDLTSRPCPCCEACTLTCQEGRTAGRRARLAPKRRATPASLRTSPAGPG